LGLVKIAGSIENCIDRSGNGLIETSGASGAPLAWGSDECVLGFMPTIVDIRGLTIDQMGNIYATSHYSKTTYIINDASSVVWNNPNASQAYSINKNNYSTFAMSGYGLAYDGVNNGVWSINSTNRDNVSFYDISTGSIKNYSKVDLYGVSSYRGYGIFGTLDFAGNNDKLLIFKLNEDTKNIELVKEIFNCDNNGSGWRAIRSIAIDSRNNKAYWGVNDVSRTDKKGVVCSYDLSQLDVNNALLPNTSQVLLYIDSMTTPLGAAMDSEGFLWLNTNINKKLFKINVLTKSVVSTTPTLDTYTYSDFTGYNVQTNTSLDGNWTGLLNTSSYTCEGTTCPQLKASVSWNVLNPTFGDANLFLKQGVNMYPLTTQNQLVNLSRDVNTNIFVQLSKKVSGYASPKLDKINVVIGCTETGKPFHELTETYCGDGLDNDCDGIADEDEVKCNTIVPISSCQDLQNINQELGRKYVLTQDINCYDDTREGGALWGNGHGFIPIGYPSYPFSGELDGNGFVIYDLFFGGGSNGTGGRAIFYKTSENAVIKNVVLKNLDINTYNKFGEFEEFVAGLVVFNSGLILNCSVEGNIARQKGDVGGLVYSNSKEGKIINSHFSGKITTFIIKYIYTISYVGGLVAYNSGEIINSYSSGEIRSSSGPYELYNIGGLVGTNSLDANISKSYSNMDINLNSDDRVYGVGGFVGSNYGRINESYSKGSIFVSSNSRENFDIGGFAGLDLGGVINSPEDYSIKDSYSKVNLEVINGTRVGGFIGTLSNISSSTGGNLTSRIKNCYSTGDVNGQSFVGGLIGNNILAYLGNAYVSNSFSTGNVIGDTNVGGLIGDAKGIVLNNSYYSGSPNNGIGFKVNNKSYFYPQPSLNNDYNKPIQNNDFVVSDWNFNGVWKKVVGDYPVLDWQDGASTKKLIIRNVRFNPVAPNSWEDVNVLFEVENLYDGEVECVIRENNSKQIKSGTGLSYNFYLSNFRAGSYEVNIFCNNEFESVGVTEYFNVLSLPDLVIENLAVRSNPDVGEEIEIVGELRYNGNYRNPANISVPVEFVYNDLNTGLVDKLSQVVSVGRNSSKLVVFKKIVNSTGWKIVEFVVDPLNVVKEENEFNNKLSKIVYGGLFDPSRASMRINVDSLVHPFERPVSSSAGFLFVGKATYILDGLVTSYPVAGAQVDVTIDSDSTSDASPLAELVAWTRSDGNFIIPYNNPRVIDDYNALIEVTDGVAYGYSLENFRVSLDSGSTDNNTPWGGWIPGSPGGPDGSGNDGGFNPGPGWDWDFPLPEDCNKADLSASLNINYPNVNFYVSGSEASDPNYSIANQAYTIRIVLNGQTINLSKTGVFNGLVYSGLIQEDSLPQIVSIYVDSGNVIEECNESNNFVQRELGAPNIRADSISVTSLNNKKIIRGELNKFNLVMRNTGPIVLNNVPVTFLVDGNLLHSYVINSINPGQSHVEVFESYLDNYGLVNFTLSTSFVDSDITDNVLDKLVTIYLPDYYIRSIEDGIRNIIITPQNPVAKEALDIIAVMKSNDVVSRSVLVPFDLMEDGVIKKSGEVLFNGGANFAQTRVVDYNAPEQSGIYNIGFYVNKELRHFEEDSMNNYATVALMVSANNLIDANVLLLKVIDDKLNFVVEKSLNTKFLSDVNVLSQIIDYINNSVDLKVDSLNKSEDIFRIRVDVNGLEYYSNYFLVKNVIFEGPCGDVIVVPNCEEGYEPTPSVDDNNCPILVCKPIIIESCWSEDVVPHPICTLEDLNRVREHLDWSYVLKNDIDASETRNWNFVPAHCYDSLNEVRYFDVSKDECEEMDDSAFNWIYWVESKIYGFKPINGSGGLNFNGNNHKIKNLFVDNKDGGFAGLFGNLNSNGVVIENLYLTDVNIVGGYGGLVGYFPSGSVPGLISNVHVTGVVNAVYGGAGIGGLVGTLGGNGGDFPKSIIRNSSFQGTVIGKGSSVGGLVGSLYGLVENSFTSGEVIGSSYVGGLVGSAGNASINASYSEMNVKCVDELTPSREGLPSFSCTQMGGFVGQMLSGEINNSYSKGDVIAINGDGKVNAGFVGLLRGNVTNSYSTGKVIGGDNNISGFANISYLFDYYGNFVNNSFWDVNVSGLNKSSVGKSKTTIEMFSPSTFVDWDNNVWSIVQGEYPKLKWQVKEKSVSSDPELNAGPVKKV